MRRSAGARPASVAGRALPLVGSFSGSSAHDLASGAFHSAWTGEASECGISSLEQQARIAVTGAGSLTFEGTWTLTAADRDQLHGTVVGTGVATDARHITLSGSYTATGGTGRFAAARAAFTVTVQHTRTALEDGISYGTQQATLDGMISSEPG